MTTSILEKFGATTAGIVMGRLCSDAKPLITIELDQLRACALFDGARKFSVHESKVTLLSRGRQRQAKA